MSLKRLVANNNTVVFIMGPTASGKTDVAIDLAQDYNIDIINADAAQVYQHMDIGTAKPNAEELAKAPHQLIDFVDPAGTYSAAAFRHDALIHIEQSLSQNKTPVLVGGSMFYFKALEQGLSSLPQADEQLRLKLESQANVIGWPAMHRQLMSIDAEIAARIKPNDPQRILRALEIHELTGDVPSKVFKQNTGTPMPYKAVKLVIAPYQRSVLHRRIEQRFLQMLKNGLVEEVEQLRKRKDIHREMTSMRTVGYRQVWSYLDGELDKQGMIDKAIASTRQLAKRQLTWLRNQSGVVWLVGYNRGTGLNSLREYFA